MIETKVLLIWVLSKFKIIRNEKVPFKMNHKIDYSLYEQEVVMLEKK